VNKYSSLYLSEVFNGIQKLARSYSREAIESLRRGSTDPGITPGEREAYARAYAKATRATGAAANGAPPRPTAATPPPRTAPPPTAGAPPRPTATGVGNAGVGTAANQAARAVSSAKPSLWSRLNPLSTMKTLKGGLIGEGVNLAADAVIPKFKDDSYLGQVGNELRDFALETGSGAVGSGAVSGGAAAIPGAVWGAGQNAVGKIWRTGAGLNELFNPYSELNTSSRDTERISKDMAQRFSQRNNKVAPVINPTTSTPIPISPAAPNPAPVSPEVTPVSPQSTPVVSTPVSPITATSTPAFKSHAGVNIVNAMPTQADRDAAMSKGIAIDNKLDSIYQDIKRQRESSGVTAAATNNSPVSEQSPVPPVSQPPQPAAVATQAPQPPPSQDNKLKSTNTPHGVVVGGNLFDKLKAEGKIPNNFQPTKAMRLGEEPLPPEIQKARDQFVSSVKPKVNAPTVSRPAQNKMIQAPRQTIMPPQQNIVQNSRLGGALGTASNLFGRVGDSMQNASRGRLGKGDQRRQTSFLPKL